MITRCGALALPLSFWKKKKLKRLASETDDIIEGSRRDSELKVRENQLAHLTRKVYDVHMRYNAADLEFRAAHEKQTVEKYRTFVDPAADEQMVKEEVEKRGSFAAVMQAQILSGNVNSSSDLINAARDAQDTLRDMAKLEEQAMELAEMFKDLALLVEEQNPLLDNILANMEEAEARVKRGVGELEKAKNARKGFLFFR